MLLCVTEFADMTDNGYVYRPGDAFPRSGVEVNEERVAELMSNTNRLGVPVVIEKAEEKPKPKKKSEEKELKEE